MNKFKQVPSDGHQMSQAGVGRGLPRSHVCLGEGGSVTSGIHMSRFGNYSLPVT